MNLPEPYTHALFLGIGGVGMSSLALHLMQNGIAVAGYDKTPSPITMSLQEKGALIFFSDDDYNLLPEPFKSSDTCRLIITPAVPADFSWFSKLKARGLEPVKRAELLAELVNPLRCIAVAGTHGKTSVSALIAFLLSESRMPMLAFVGGILNNWNSNYFYQEGEAVWAVAEADEFDRSFLHIRPQTSVITSVEPDHLDVYGTTDAVYDAFQAFANKLMPGGIALFHWDVNVPLPENGYRYGLNVECDYYPLDYQWVNNSWNFKFCFRGDIVGTFKLPIPGLHNLSNATAALAVLHSMGIDVNAMASHLSDYKGVRRRMERIVQTSSCVYYDDYAHHPTEVQAAISAVRAFRPDAKLQVFFQPHLYSRTRDFAKGFAEALSIADEVVLLDIYPARELPIEGVTSQTIGQFIPDTVKLSYAGLQNAVEFVNPEASIILTLGAGSIETLRVPLAECLTKSPDMV
jgi:UDP-N-acetylmuramate--alanine ligase